MRVAIVVDSGFQDEEFIYPYYRCLEAGHETFVLTPDGKDRFGKFGVPARAHYPIVENMEADGLIIPGGFESPDRLRSNPAALALVRNLHQRGACIGAICHGPWVLISAGIVKGVQVTGYKSIRDDLVNAGAHFVEAFATAHGNIVTADHYRNNGAFMALFLDVMTKNHPSMWLETHASVV